MAYRTCLEPDELSRYSIGDLPDERYEAVAEHLQSCETCTARLTALDARSDALILCLRKPVPDDPYQSESPCRSVVEQVRGLSSHSSSPAPTVSELGQYELLTLLGQGGMGTVYKARHRKLDKLVAVKLMTTDPPARDGAAHAEAVARFEREMKAVAQLEHPHIVAAKDAGESQGILYLVMEYVDGIDFSTLVDRQGALPVAEACELVRQAALGLHHAHQRGIVHRDIKPSNLMLARVPRVPPVAAGAAAPLPSESDSGQPVVKVLDLGLARLDTRIDERAVTNTGQVLGTIDYMAPEQLDHCHDVDARADVYSLGATLYKLLSGRAPFAGQRYATWAQRLKALACDQPQPLSELRPEIPVTLSQLVDGMLAKAPDDRPASAGEVAEQLAPLARGADVGSLLASRPLAHRPQAVLGPKRRSRLTWLTCVLSSLALLLILATIIITIRYPDGREDRFTTSDTSQIVVTTEPGGSGDAARAAPQVEKRAFELKRSRRDESIRCDDLATAVERARSGDVIEIHGNGPFLTRGIKVGSRALTIRAADHFHPVIQLSADGVRAGEDLLLSQGPLSLEGIELRYLQYVGGQEIDVPADKWPKLLWAQYGPVRIANCRLVQDVPRECLAMGAVSDAKVVNTEVFMSGGTLIHLGLPADATAQFENCVGAGGSLILRRHATDTARVKVSFSRSTLVHNRTCLVFQELLSQQPDPHDGMEAAIKLQASDCILGADATLVCFEESTGRSHLPVLAPAAAEQMLRRLMHWSGERNAYDLTGAWLSRSIGWKELMPVDSLQTLSDWRDFWSSAEAGSQEVQIPFQGDTVRFKAEYTVDLLTTDDFRIDSDSRARLNLTDRGADASFVGPGTGYAQWKQSSAYSPWKEEAQRLTTGSN